MSANDTKKSSRTDWARLESMTDEEIDYSDSPPTSDEEFARAELRIPKRPSRVTATLKLDPDVFAWFKSHESEREYQRRINTVLRDYIRAQQLKTA